MPKQSLKPGRVVWAAAWASAIGALIPSCSVHEHEPVRVLSGTAGQAGGRSGNVGAGGALGGRSGGASTGGSGAAGRGAEGGRALGGGGAMAGSGGAGGGAPMGGAPATGGAATSAGGSATGGLATGGSAGRGGATGSASGGAPGTGGSAGRGSAATGGAATGGSSTGGTATGGSATGGAATGGAAGRAGAGGATSSGGTPGSGGTTTSGGCNAQDTGPAGPSCAAPIANCQGGDSCCTNLCVPGGNFVLGGDIEVPTCQATVASYFLDKYEVTVARFRKFVAAYDGWRMGGNPKADVGAHPLIASSGWQDAWTTSLPPTAADLQTKVSTACDAAFSTWSSTGDTDRLPMNCVDWFQAFAFCAWDGGRLPTEAEWEYAAARGNEGTRYPWGTASPTTDRASFGCFDGGASGCSTKSAIVPAGSKPNGAGKWGHLDLAGSMLEWVLDYWATPYPARSDNSALVSGDPLKLFLRAYRSSAWGDDASQLPIAIRNNEEPTAHGAYLGFRCARPAR